MPNNNLFSEFPPVSKADWLQQISKDLKGRPLEDFDWNISDQLRMSPFVHREDAPPVFAPITGTPGSWEICEAITVEDSFAANVEALAALNGGTEGLEFEFSTAPDYVQIEAALSSIHLDFIGLHFSGKGVSQNPAAVFGHLLRLAKARGLDTELLRGSVGYDPAQAGGIITDWRYLADLMAFSQDTFPQFKVITVNFSELENPVTALAETLEVGNNYFQELTKRGVSAEQIGRYLQFSVPIGKSYFLEIAKIRAFKLLWIHVLKGWGAPLRYPTIAAHFQPATYSSEIFTNMIRATTLAMSAVIGGANRLTVLPYDADRTTLATYPPSFGKRIARNVQHLMKMESGLDTMADPAAGSYYIEQLTGQLSDKAWELFAMS